MACKTDSLPGLPVSSVFVLGGERRLPEATLQTATAQST